MDAGNYDLTARISSNSSEVQVSLICPDGAVSQKTISVDDLITQLASSHRISTDILPRGTRFYKGSPSDYYIGVELIPKKRPLQIENIADIKFLPVPRSLFVMHIKNNRAFNTWLYCLIGPLNSWSEPLYGFPYGNVYEDGRICWGDAQIPNITKPMDLLGAFAMFFDSGFNGDLVNDGAFVPPIVPPDVDPVDNLWDLVRYVENMEEFPEDLMSKKDYTLAQVIERSS